MQLKRINSAIDRVGRNDINENFDILERGYGKAAIDAQEAKTIADNIDGKATQALQNSTNAVATSDDAINLAESVQRQFNQVVIEGDSSVEAAQARVGADATTYDTLKARLDTENTQVIQQLAQNEMLVDDILVNVSLFGAVGDDTTDDTQALLDAKQYCITNNKTLYIPPYMTCYVPNGIDFFGLRNIQCDGVIRGDVGKFIDFGFNSAKVEHTKYTFGYVKIATLRMMGLKNSDITVNRAEHLLLFADGDATDKTSLAYNRLYLGLVEHLELNSSGANGWINENKFFAGRIFKLTVDGTYNHNHNVFFSPSIEGSAIVHFKKGRHNRLEDVRCEGTPTFQFDAGTDNNLVSRGWYNTRASYFYGVNQSALNLTVIDNGNANNVISTQDLAYSNRKILNYDYRSNNYNVNIITKQSDTQNLKCVASWAVIYKTDLIPLEYSFSFIALSDASIFRVRMRAYDENKNLLTTLPTDLVDWVGVNINGDNAVSPTNQSTIPVFVRKHNDVKYVDFEISFGSASANVTFSKLEVYLKELTKSPLKISSDAKNSLFTATGVLPTSGVYEIGDYVKNLNPIILGNTGSKYVIRGWIRTTSGSNHVLNTDWVEDKVLTGT